MNSRTNLPVDNDGRNLWSGRLGEDITIAFRVKVTVCVIGEALCELDGVAHSVPTDDVRNHLIRVVLLRAP